MGILNLMREEIGNQRKTSVIIGGNMGKPRKACNNYVLPQQLRLIEWRRGET